MLVEKTKPSTSLTRREKFERAMANPGQWWAVLNARAQFRTIPQLPFSVRLHGRAHIAGGQRIRLGERVHMLGTTVPVELCAFGRGQIEIGDRTFVNYGVSIAAWDRVSIGEDCLIGQYTIINDNDFHDVENKLCLPPSAPVILEDRVWLGARVIVQKGVRIGSDAVISAGSVVTRDVPPRSVAAGVPARVLRSF
jgi:acetyltransferase-like isoleucine patch superfamily enzyme